MLAAGSSDRVTCWAAVALVDLRDRLPDRRDRDPVITALGEAGGEGCERRDVRRLIQQQNHRGPTAPADGP